MHGFVKLHHAKKVNLASRTNQTSIKPRFPRSLFSSAAVFVTHMELFLRGGAPARPRSWSTWWGKWTCCRRSAPRCTARRCPSRRRLPRPSSPWHRLGTTSRRSGGLSAPSAASPRSPRRVPTRRSRWSACLGAPTSSSPGAARGPSGRAALRPGQVTSPPRP